MNSATHAMNTNVSSAPISSTCDVPPAFASPNRRKMKYSAIPPAVPMNVPTIRTTISAR